MAEEKRLKEEAIKQLEWIKPKKPWSKDGINTKKAIEIAIDALNYDDVKYHEEHGEVIVEKAAWEDAKKALEVVEDIKSEIEQKLRTDYKCHRKVYEECLDIIDRHISKPKINILGGEGK